MHAAHPNILVARMSIRLALAFTACGLQPLRGDPQCARRNTENDPPDIGHQGIGGGPALRVGGTAKLADGEPHLRFGRTIRAPRGHGPSGVDGLHRAAGGECRQELWRVARHDVRDRTRRHQWHRIGVDIHGILGDGRAHCQHSTNRFHLRPVRVEPQEPREVAPCDPQLVVVFDSVLSEHGEVPLDMAVEVGRCQRDDQHAFEWRAPRAWQGARVRRATGGRRLEFVDAAVVDGV
eukprot:2012846-Prymnesium_polylepis.1